MMNELVDAQNFNFLDICETAMIHTYIYIHTSLYLPSDFRIAYETTSPTLFDQCVGLCKSCLCKNISFLPI